jgi:hypothetical protein
MSEQVDHEDSDINVRAILGVGAGVIVAGIVIAAVVWSLYAFLANREATGTMSEFPLAASQQQRLPPEPRLQTDPREDLRVLKQAEEEALKSYGWIDKNGGVVRIPIDQAMKLTVERGLPVRTESGKKP